MSLQNQHLVFSLMTTNKPLYYIKYCLHVGSFKCGTDVKLEVMSEKFNVLGVCASGKRNYFQLIPKLKFENQPVSYDPL
jgi:N-acetylglucosamine-6-phosphate deacetylase